MTNKSDTQSKEVEWEKELSDCECTGYTCRHETSETHYLVDRDFINEIVMQTQVRCGLKAFKEVMDAKQSLQREMVEKIEGMKIEDNGHEEECDYQMGMCDCGLVERKIYNKAINQAISLLKETTLSKSVETIMTDYKETFKELEDK